MTYMLNGKRGFLSYARFACCAAEQPSRCEGKRKSAKIACERKPQRSYWLSFSFQRFTKPPF